MTELEAVPGVGPGAAKKLHDAFITTAELLAVQNPAEMKERTGISEGTALKIIRAARTLVGGYGFRSALEVEREMEESPALSTGSEMVDKGIRGGIEQGSIVEFYGTARSGKTQWCATLAVMVQLPLEQGGLEGRVLWMDTETSFKPWIIRGMAIRRGLDPEVTLGNIAYAPILVSQQFNDLFRNIPRLCAEKNYKLVIIDSFTGLFRAEFGQLGNLRSRQAEMNRLLNEMRRAGVATGATFVISNQVMGKPPPFGARGGNPNAPAGGHILSHASDYRFYLGVGKKDHRKITLKDNAGVPEFTCELGLGWGGFYDDSTKMKAESKTIEELLEARGCDTEAEKKETATGPEQEVAEAA